MIVTMNKLTSMMIYIISAAVAITIITFASTEPIKNWAIWFSIATLLLLMITFISFRKSNIRILSIYGLVAVMSYLFQFGSAFCLAVNYESDKLVSRMAYYGISSDAFKESACIALVCVIMFTIGGMIENLLQKHNNKMVLIEKGLGINPHFYKMMGYLILIISAPLWIYTLAYTARTIILGGSYTVLAEAALPGYITSFGKFIYVGIMMIIFYHHLNNNVWRKRIWILVFLVLLGSVMIFGSRSEPITILFAFLIFCDKCLELRKKLNYRNIVVVLILIFILINTLYSIQISRNSGFNISDVVSKFFSNGPKVLMNEVFEFGYTEYSTASVINNISSYHPSWFFIKEICSITPIPIQSEYTVVASVAAGTPELGTSFVGEMYYYFGHFCYLACFAIALYIVKIEKWINRQTEDQNYYIFFMFLMWMWQEVNCIRAAFNLSIKTMIYSFVLFEFVRMIYTSAYHGKRYKKEVRL